MVYTLYILYSSSLDKYYIGHTGDDMAERLRRHLSNHSGFTGKAKDWEIVYREEYSAKQMASQRELQLKHWKSRKRIEALIREQSSADSARPGF